MSSYSRHQDVSASHLFRWYLMVCSRHRQWTLYTDVDVKWQVGLTNIHTVFNTDCFRICAIGCFTSWAAPSQIMTRCATLYNGTFIETSVQNTFDITVLACPFGWRTVYVQHCYGEYAAPPSCQHTYPPINIHCTAMYLSINGPIMTFRRTVLCWCVIGTADWI